MCIRDRVSLGVLHSTGWVGGDLDGDGNDELVAASADSCDYLGFAGRDPTPGPAYDLADAFTLRDPQGQNPCVDQPTIPRFADLDNDGDLDLLGAYTETGGLFAAISDRFDAGALAPMAASCVLIQDLGGSFLMHLSYGGLPPGAKVVEVVAYAACAPGQEGGGPVGSAPSPVAIADGEGAVMGGEWADVTLLVPAPPPGTACEYFLVSRTLDDLDVPGPDSLFGYLPGASTCSMASSSGGDDPPPMKGDKTEGIDPRPRVEFGATEVPPGP